jgi:predicted adenine nucleotide alpha hydrolase (AANH) superfamily ATPase
MRLTRALSTAPLAKRVLLHSCCAPCSGAMIEEMHAGGHDVTVFFYNPNIHPRREYLLRKEENLEYARALGIDFIDADYDVAEWMRRAKGMEFSPERGKRCTMCFDMRFERTALHAAEHGFPLFTTTNATSRWKDVDQVNASGERAAAKYDGVDYWKYDWQTDSMTSRKYEINASRRFYKQQYCGCTYSLRDSNEWRAEQGMEPIELGVDFYDDAVADAEEESRTVVDSFFDKYAHRNALEEDGAKVTR